MKKIELPVNPILENKNAKSELIYSFLCECERLFNWMDIYGFDFTDIRNYSFHKCELTYFGELMELIFGKFEKTKNHFIKLRVHIFRPIMKKKYSDKKLIYFKEYLGKRYKIQKYLDKQ